MGTSSRWARARSGSGTTVERDEHGVPQDRRRDRVRPGQRGRRGGPRHLDRRRQGRRPPSDPESSPAGSIDASGLVVMPGGVNMHCHIVGSKVNTARMMCPELTRRPRPSPAPGSTRSGTMGIVPSTFLTGYKYAGLGYTTAFDAAIAPLAARHAHDEFADTPCIDKGFFALMGNNHYIMRSHPAGRAREAEGVRRLAAWRGERLCGEARQSGRRRDLEASPGGERQGPGHAGRWLRRDAPPDHRGRSHGPSTSCACRIPSTSTANNLGLPGNWTTTLETMKLLDGPPRAPDPHPVPQLCRRRRRRGHLRLEGRPARRVRQRAPEPHGGRRPGRLRPDDEHDRRRAGRLLPEPAVQDQVVQQRHRAGGGLRHRADRIQEHQPDPRLAVGDRAGVVPAGRAIPGGSR